MKKHNSLEQYLKLYKENEIIIKKKSPKEINLLRDIAYERLLNLRLPDENIEGYEKTSLEKFFEPNMGINIASLDLIDKKTATGCGVTSINSLRIILHNDVIVSIILPKGYSRIPDGMVIEPLSVAWKKDPEKIAGLLKRNVEQNNAAELLNLLFLHEGVFISTKPGFKCDFAVQIINYIGASVPMLTLNRILVEICENSELKILSCDHSIKGNINNTNRVNEVVEIILDKNSRLTYVNIEETSSNIGKLSQLFVTQSFDSNLKVNSYTLVNGITRNNFFIRTEGDHTVTHLNGLVIGRGNSHTDNFTFLSHSHNHGKSSQLFKYSLDDSSNGSFGGLIQVAPNARFNEAYQTNRNIIVSKQGRMYSKPQLLIYNDDVKCSHGATTGQLDPKQIFYMQTRGIPFAEARSMLIQAFMNEVIDRLEFPGLTERLYHLVERRLKGEDLLCENCILSENA